MSELAKIIDQTEARFNQIAPTGLDYNCEKGFAVQLLKNNSWLANVAHQSPQSLQQAITNVAAIGLSLNPAKKQAYLITRKIKVKNDRGQDEYHQRIFLEPSYMGLCDLATLSGCVEWVQANVVYQNDQYMNNGPGERPTHTYNAFAKPEDRGPFVGVYCVAKTSSGGDYLTTELDKHRVESIRDRSEAWKSKKAGPWKTDFEEMAKKSVIRNAFKTWPKAAKSEQLSEAIQMSNDNEGFEPILTAPEISSYHNDQKKYFDSLITNNDALGMYVFAASIEEGTLASLMGSFEKDKVKYKNLVSQLTKNGKETFTDIQISFEDALNGDDSALLAETLEDLSQECITLLEEKLSPEHAHIYREMKGAA